MSIMGQLQAGITTQSADETQAIATEFGRVLPADATLALHGNLGAGKTTFVQGLARGLGIDEPVTSPTFTLYNIHRAPPQGKGPGRVLVHLDAYRLEGVRQLDDLLLEDFLTSPWCLAIEWPERIAEWLPPGSLHLELGIDAAQNHTLRLR